METKSFPSPWRNRAVAALFVAFILLLLGIWLYLQWDESKLSILRLNNDIEAQERKNKATIQVLAINSSLNRLRWILDSLLEHTQFAINGSLLHFNSMAFSATEFEKTLAQISIKANDKFKNNSLQSIGVIWIKLSQQANLIQKGKGTIILYQEHLQALSDSTTQLTTANDFLYQSLRRTKIKKLKSALIKSRKSASKIKLANIALHSAKLSSSDLGEYANSMKLYKTAFTKVKKYRRKMHIKDRRLINNINRTLIKINKKLPAVQGIEEIYLSISQAEEKLINLAQDLDEVLIRKSRNTGNVN